MASAVMGIACRMEVAHLGGRVLRVAFGDGLVRELDRAGALSGVLALIGDDRVFPAEVVDRVTRTVAWPVGVDLDPDVLHGDQPPASGSAPTGTREYRRVPAR